MGKSKAQQKKQTLKVDVIKYKYKSRCGSRSLAEKFCRKNRDKILREFETTSKQRSACKTGYEKLTN